MAMIKCPECGKEVSNKAETCPNCGYPLNEYINYDEDKTDEEENEMKESVCSILSLVFYILGIASKFMKVPFSLIFILFWFISCILAIVAHLQKRTKCVCATIVFWLITIGFILSIFLMVINALLTN